MNIETEVKKYFRKRTGKNLDLSNPESYNQKIHWLKIYNQKINQVICSDKRTAKLWVANKVGNEHIIPNTTDYPCTVKPNHMSGEINFIKNEKDLNNAIKKVEAQLDLRYATFNGEWAYRYIRPCIIRESFIDCANVDYKFHCSNGNILWLEMLWDRGPKQKESIIDENGKVMGLHQCHAFTPTKQELLCNNYAFEQMKDVARELSKDFKYVRVDLYWNGNTSLFGELTYWPGAGFYRTKDNLKFGQMLDIDLSTTQQLLFDDKFYHDLDLLYQEYEE